jgi:hypothetical protein
MVDTRIEVAAVAARWVVEEGLDYGAAKQKAMHSLGLTGRAALPDNDLMEAAVRDYIATFCADTQLLELRALRQCAVQWMERLQAFRPYLTGAVWQGTATHLSDIYLQLFCDDVKSAELTLINQGVRYSSHSRSGLRGEPMSVLSLDVLCPELQEHIGVHLSIHDRDDVRQVAKVDSSGRPLRGDLTAVRRLLEEEI